MIVTLCVAAMFIVVSAAVRELVRDCYAPWYRSRLAMRRAAQAADEAWIAELQRLNQAATVAAKRISDQMRLLSVSVTQAGDGMRQLAEALRNLGARDE